METDTPRTLLSLSLKHGNPVKTVRRSTRKGSTLRQQATDNNGLQERAEMSKAINLPAASDNNLEVVTPRALISDALLTHNIQNTVRVPVQRLQAHSFKRQDKDAHNEKDKADNSPVKTSLPDSSSRIDKANSAVNEFRSNDVVADAEDHIVLPTSGEDETVVLDCKEKTKRLRLSEIDIRKIPESSDLEAFSVDLLAKVKVLIKDKESLNVSEKKEKKNKFLEAKLSSAKKQSNLDASLISNNQNKQLPRKDVSTNTISFLLKSAESKSHKFKLSKESSSQKLSHRLEHINEEELYSKDHKEIIHNADEAILPSTVSEVSSDCGPLNLNGITEGREVGLSGKDRNSIRTSETKHSTPLKNHELTGTEKFRRQSRRFNPGDDSDMWPDSLLVKEDEILDQDPEENISGRPHAMSLSQNVQKSKDSDVIPTEKKKVEVHLSERSWKKASPAKIPVKKQPVKRRRKSNNLPISRAQLCGIVQHYSSLKFSREALNEIEVLSGRYFNQTASCLEEICAKKKIKRILTDDVTYLMKRRRHITAKKSLNVLIEENFPLEYREELVQVATAGNNVLP